MMNEYIKSEAGDESRSFLPCPFCGGTPRHLPFKAGFYYERVVCDTCAFHLTPDAWSRRATLDTPQRQAGFISGGYKQLGDFRPLNTEQPRSEP